MVFKCPQCGKQYDVSNPPQAQTVFRCTNPACGEEFTIQQTGEMEDTAPANTRDVAKALAQDYFSDILSAEPAQGVQQAAPTRMQSPAPAESARPQSYQPAPEYPRETEKAARRKERQSRQPAREEPEDIEAAEQRREQQWKQKLKGMHEKKSQRTVCRILLIFAILIPLARIAATRMLADEAQFARMRQQLLPSALYFFAAFGLIICLLRRTNKPQWFFAALLPLPLILDAWYLVPQLLEVLPEEKWFVINCGVKLLFLVLGLLMSIRARKHPAKKHRSILE